MYTSFMDILSNLKNCYFCHDLDPGELKALADIAVPKGLARGEMLFFEGDPATGFYALLGGRVRLYKASPDGKEYTLHQIRPGQLFAEVAIFKVGHFPANCIAQEESLIAFFPKERFLELLQASPQISLKIIASLSGFLRDFNRQLEELSLKEVPARIASFLLSEHEKSKKNVVSLDTSKSELANRLGTISETLSRNLRRLKENGVIEVDHKKITILDKERLSAIANGEKI
ncbi:MAG: Crp/Fnr family transcriptional regulator [Candidatus Zixiibacteriota bacterium]|nr:MAG: Crp/Fnr family transcriptional regulator [candidate division Zixibacteria bacterium]